MISYQVEDWAEVWQEASKLWAAHYDEVGQGVGFGWELKPDLPLCHRLGDLGQWMIITVRDSGKLVGYHASIVTPLLHYSQILGAKSDLYWLHPDYRRGRIAFKLFLEVERAARQRGVQALYDATKLSFDQGRLFEKLGYLPLERRYVKLLEA